jgi:ABC-type transport system substrate-binding protein
LDPKGKDFGPNAKYFRHDVAEARKLLTAAGYPNGFHTTSSYVTGPQLGGAPTRIAVIDGFFREAGIIGEVNSIDYLKEYIPNYRDGKGQYEGWSYFGSDASAGESADTVDALANHYWSKSGSGPYKGFSTSGKNDQSGDRQVDALIEKARLERDTEKRRALVFDLQRYLAKTMYGLLGPGIGSSFLVAWPCIGNFAVYQGARHNHRLWVDTTKPPLGLG